MADGFDVVEVGILHEPAVVVGVIFGPEAGLAIVHRTKPANNQLRLTLVPYSKTTRARK
jgi:hypothetical protein